MELPTTRLPVVKSGVFDGLIASDNWNVQQIMDDMKITNYAVWRFVQHVLSKHGQETAKIALLLYKVLDTQAECDELNGEDQ